jgi:hypothetical protein
MLRCLLANLLFTPMLLSGQSVSTGLGARAAALGYASGTLADEWAIFNNIAGIANVQNFQTGFAYEARATISGANRMGFLLTSPLGFGTAGLGVFRFGDDLYSEQAISLGYASKIGNTSLGARASYLQYRALGFGTKGVLGINIGGITQITPKILIGAWIQNINQPKLRFDDAEKAPVKLTASLAVKPTDHFTWIAEVEKDVLYEPLWKTGMEYWIHKKLATRLGFNINPRSFFCGIGFNGWRIKADYAIQGFSDLGVAHQLSASYRINKTERTK